METPYWYFFGLAFCFGPSGYLMSAPNEFWSIWPQWKDAGYFTLTTCDTDPYDSPQLVPTRKFWDVAVKGNRAV